MKDIAIDDMYSMKIAEDKLIFKIGSIEYVISKYLYRYLKINDRLYESLSNGQLWFTDPKSYNDPYDCNLNFDSECTEEEFRLFAIIENGKTRNLNHTDLESHIKNRFSQWHLINTGFKKSLEDITETLGVCSFSQAKNKLLMWSHYADGHRGVCLKFNLLKMPLPPYDSLKYVPYKITYTQNPNFSFIKEYLKYYDSEYNIFPRVLVQHILATKSEDYKYEDEVRLVADMHWGNTFRGWVNFDKEALMEINFGYKADLSDERIKKIQQIVESTYGNQLKFFKTELKKKEFGLDFIPIN